MEDVTPPPMEPPAIICINVWNGKTKAKLASATVPNCPTYQASVNVTAVSMVMATTFGPARRQSSSGTGACSMRSK